MAKKEESGKNKVLITKNGPYIISGKLPLKKEIIVPNSEGVPEKWTDGDKYPETENYVLCRCGHSNHKPFCDGTHHKINFDGTETADDKKCLKEADRISGPALILKDAKELCASAAFCHRGKGVWNATEDSGNPESKKLAIEEACNCPSGRLTACDKKTGKPIEPDFKQSISIVEDPCNEVSGPIWVKGGFFIESESGKKYETRNRATLCRCGKSTNKPFCDGSHIDFGFDDGDKSLKKKK